MRKRKSYKIMANLMAVFLLFSSFSYSIDFHYCKGELKSVSLFGEAKACHEKKIACPVHGTMLVKDTSGCCENETEYVQGLDEKSLLVQDFLLNSFDFALPPFDSFDPFATYTTTQKLVNFIHYKPPLPARDLPVLHQSFLL